MNQPLIEITNLARWGLGLSPKYRIQVVLDNTENSVNLMVVVNLKLFNITINEFGLDGEVNERVRKHFKFKILRECYKNK